MPCNYCVAKFCVFRTEKRCPSCGFSYCPKCLNNTIYVKQLKVHKKVCVRCSQYSSSGEVHVIPPPDFCTKNASEEKNPPKSKSWEKKNVNSSNVPNRNANKGDENSPSTSTDHQKINNGGSDIAAKSQPSRKKYSSDDSSDYSEDDDLEVLAAGLELERESQRIADQIHREKYPHLYDKSRLVKIDDTRSTDEILRDAIKQLQEGLWDKVDRNRPPKCTLCSTKALVNCKGCESTFCMKCFDMHSDPVCAKYETLEPHKEN